MADLNTIGGIHYEMMRRCYNPNSIAFKHYGAKGIKVCEPWKDRETFRKWACENGYKKGLRLNRKDSTKDYTPDNCFWGEVHKANREKTEAIKKRIEANKNKKASVGLKKYTDSPLMKTYYSMHTRCENPNQKYYKHYGGRGIKVCDEWSGKEGFYNFLKWARNSNYSPGLTLDRIDNNKGYSPDNCKWSTTREQLKNRRTARIYDYRGMKLLLIEIAEMENVSLNKLTYRVKKKGMTVEDAVKELKEV